MESIEDYERFTNREILNFFEIGHACDALFLTEEDAWLNRFQVHEKWGEDARMGTFSNGGGDELFVVVKDGIFMKGFEHESEISRHAREDYSVFPDMYTGFPRHLEAELHDPALEYEDVTFCCWRVNDDGPFKSGADLSEVDEYDDVGFLLSCVYSNADDYIEHARDYFECWNPDKEKHIRRLFSSLA